MGHIEIYLYSRSDSNRQRLTSWVWDFKSHAFQPVSPLEHLFEPMEGLEPPLDYTSLVYKTSAVATEPHRHIMEESLKSDFTEGLEPSKVCFEDKCVYHFTK